MITLNDQYGDKSKNIDQSCDVLIPADGFKANTRQSKHEKVMNIK